MALWLMAFLGCLALIAGLPLLGIVFNVAWDWYEHWIERLETAAVRFSRRRGWR